MKKKSTVLILLLALSMIAVLSLKPIVAEPVPKPGIVEWYDEPPGGPIEGELVHESLACDPEWLKVRTTGDVHSDTEIIVQGKDCYDQDIEAKALIPQSTPVQREFPLIDWHSREPVTFSKITAIFQQGGTHCNSFDIETLPEGYPDPDFEEYLGHAGKATGWQPGYPAAAWTPQPSLPPPYYHTKGDGITPAQLPYPPEPSNPDPIKIVVNWRDADKDLYFDSGEEGKAAGFTILHIEGIDQCGNKQIVDVSIAKDAKIVSVGDRTFSTICKIEGGYGSDSYYIFTEPKEQRKIFTYNIRIDHVTLHPECYDTFAHPNYPIKITIALRDQDGHLVHSADDETLVNLKTSGGEIRPSCDLWIKECHETACAQLIPDTNPRNVKVTAIVNVPKVGEHDPMNLISWTEVCFDGVSSVYYTGDTIHVLMWGYGGTGDTNYPAPQGPFPVPPLPWLPGTPEREKLNGPIYKVYIPLVPGCNLISTPIHPMLCTEFGWPEGGIPMDILFGKDSSACQTIEAIWWYEPDGSWHSYIPGVDDNPDAHFRDGLGYWVKAEKPCTIVVSGVFMENAPFMPPRYALAPQRWNLMGVTSLTGIKIEEYFESASGGSYSGSMPFEVMSAAGPVWVYYAKYRSWTRNPPWGLFPTEAFWVFNKLPTPIYLAP